jgi:hypothetical protein
VACEAHRDAALLPASKKGIVAEGMRVALPALSVVVLEGGARGCGLVPREVMGRGQDRCAPAYFLFPEVMIGRVIRGGGFFSGNGSTTFEME